MYSSVFGNIILAASLVYLPKVMASDVNTKNKDSLGIVYLQPIVKHPVDAATKDRLNKAIKAMQASNEKELHTKYEHVLGGGYSGNLNTGILTYDGLPSHLPALSLVRDPKSKTCYLKNKSAHVYYYNPYHILRHVSYECASTNPEHNNLYWNEQISLTNGAYAFANDALYAGTQVSAMYWDWLRIHPLHKEDGSEYPLNFALDTVSDNSYFYGGVLFMSGGNSLTFPEHTLNAISSATAFVFDKQNAGLEMSNQSGAILISFMTMSSHAIDYYTKGQNDWTLFSDVAKSGLPLMYTDQPSKDCGEKEPGDNCSIDHLSQYRKDMNPFFASGIYRRAFYLLATTPDWDTKKVFSIIVHADRIYWTSRMGFSKGLCGLIKAAHDFNYNTSDVVNAFEQVGVGASDCE